MPIGIPSIQQKSTGSGILQVAFRGVDKSTFKAYFPLTDLMGVCSIETPPPLDDLGQPKSHGAFDAVSVGRRDLFPGYKGFVAACVG